LPHGCYEKEEIGMFKFFLKGGPLMWPILLCSVISITITLERFYHFYRARTKIPNIFARVKRFLQEGKADEALKLCEGASGPIPHILAIGIRIRNRSLEEKEKLIARAGSRNYRQHNAFIRVVGNSNRYDQGLYEDTRVRRKG